MHVDFTHPLGATAPSRGFQILKADGTPQDISGATAKFRIRRKGEDAVLIERDCTIADEANAIFQFDWDVDDFGAGYLDAAGFYVGTLEITFADSKIGKELHVDFALESE